MAELNNEANKKASTTRRIRSKKLTWKVDLTAMVDLAFLLITFFMLTTSLSQPKSMDVTMPDKVGAPMPTDEKRSMTILIGDDNKVRCFMGKLNDNPIKNLNLHTPEFRKELSDRKKDVLAYSTAKGKPDQGLIVLIKPGKNSHYGSLVDVLDEMAILDVPTYAIVDIDPNEARLLK